MNTVIELQKQIPDDATSAALSLIMNDAGMERMLTAAKIMASAKVTVPKHLQGQEGDCLAIIMQAAQWGLNPFAVAQKTHVINGALGYEAQLVNAVVQASGAISGHFHYEYDGDGQALSCRVGAVIRGETGITWGNWLSISDVKTQNSPLWKTNPRQQLGYLQIKNWSRAYCPGAILGVYSTDELAEIPEKDMGNVEIVPEAAQEKPASKTETLREKVAAKRKRKEGNRHAHLDEVLSAIIAAETLAALDEIATLAAALEIDEEKAKAREAWKQRRATLLHVDTETGEVIAQQLDGPQITYAEVAGKLQQATGQDDLDLAADLINSVPDPQQRIELSAIYADRVKELDQ